MVVGGWFLCLHVPFDEDSKTTAFTPLKGIEFLDTILKLLLSLKLHFSLFHFIISESVSPLLKKLHII